MALLEDHDSGVHSVAWSRDEAYMVMASSMVDRIALIDMRACPTAAAAELTGKSASLARAAAGERAYARPHRAATAFYLGDLRSHPAVLVAAAAASRLRAYWARGIAYLDVRHPHEDAYILFRYVNNLVTGEGISFNPGGPPTEGATDLLWMILLSGLVRLGVDVARAAVLLNAAGCGLLAWVVVRVWLLPARPGVVAHVAAFALAVCLPWLPGAQAAYDGFSLQLYTA